MPTSIDKRLSSVHPKMLGIHSESDRKKVAAIVARAFALLGITQQEAAFAMGYRDQGTVSRWVSAVERPQFDKLLAIDGFEDAWLLALAERNTRVDVSTQITVRRRA